MYKDLVVGCNSKVKLDNNSYVHCINFDNAATTPPFKSVLKGIVEFSPNYSSIHRGTGHKSIISSRAYEDARETVLDFVKGNSEKHTVIFLKNTTECINKLSYRLKEKLKDKIVLTTYMEHHSNMLPWRYRYNIDYVEVDRQGRLCLEDLESKLIMYKGKVGLLAVSGASNVTGYINPIHEIAKLCHRYGAKILVDGAQLIPHSPFDMKDINNDDHIDYITFSSHKMYSPFGIGVLVAPKDDFIHGYSEQIGGGTVKHVSLKDVVWDEPPAKEEAGTPNLMGVVALSISIKTIQGLDMRKVEDYERKLIKYALNRMSQIPNLVIYDDMDVDKKVSILSFNIEGLDHSVLANILAVEDGIAVRNGCFCAQPYVQKLLDISDMDSEKYMEDETLPKPGLVRISFALYNNYDEIDLLVYLLNKIGTNIEFYQDKYNKPAFY